MQSGDAAGRMGGCRSRKRVEQLGLRRLCNIWVQLPRRHTWIEGTGTHGSWAGGRDVAVAGTGRPEPWSGCDDPRGAKRTPKDTHVWGQRGPRAPLTATANASTES